MTRLSSLPTLTSCSVESLLSIPLQFIFRETTGNGNGTSTARNHRSFIFSKNECATLLRVNMLSTDLDAMLFLVYDALDRSQICKSCKDGVVSSNNSSYGLAMLPILHVHSETSNVALAHVTDENFGIPRLLNELRECANDLQKFAEQNHTLADQLDNYGQNNILSIEKRAIAEIEDAIVERIEELCLLSSSLESSTTKQNQNNTEEEEGLSQSSRRSSQSRSRKGQSTILSENEESSMPMSMSDLCGVLFHEQKLDPSSAERMPQSMVAGKVEFTESQMNAAEALQIMHSSSS